MKPARQYLFPICLLVAMSAACAPERIREVRDYNATFVCDGGERVQVRFAPFKAVLESQDASIDLVQQPVASGFLYTGGGQSLRARGDEATWTDGKGAGHRCRATIAGSPKSDTAAR